MTITQTHSGFQIERRHEKPLFLLLLTFFLTKNWHIRFDDLFLQMLKNRGCCFQQCAMQEEKLGNKNARSVPKYKEYNDNPYKRYEAGIRDLIDPADNVKPISMLRIAALKHARLMPISEDGDVDSETAEYIYSQPASSGKSNWIQMGPTAMPHAVSHTDRQSGLLFLYIYVLCVHYTLSIFDRLKDMNNGIMLVPIVISSKINPVLGPQPLNQVYCFF
jgi:hypothetical protein